MKVTLEPTDKIVELNGVPARIWEGETELGVRCHAFITRIACDRSVSAQEFETALRETRAPSPEVAEAYPLRMIL